MTPQDATGMAPPSVPPANGSSSQLAPKTRPRSRPPKANKGSMNGPLYLQSSSKIFVRRSKRKGESPWKQMTSWFVDNQIGFSFNLVALLFLAHASIPKAREHTVKFFTLSYFNPTTGNYAIGFDDAYLLSFGIIIFTGLRAACMEYVLAPFAKWRGLNKRKDVTRFSEQAWLLIYDSIFWSLGLYIYYNSPYWLNTEELWINWPIREISGLMKGYMLAQWSFWLQQVIVINIEERRKDHWQMLTHHFITIALIHASYNYHHTRVGNLILVLMDVVDILLPLAKCLKYLGHTVICDYAFGTFMVTWFFSRHVAFPVVLYSVWKDTPTVIHNGCYQGPNDSIVGPFEPPNGFLHYIEPFYAPQGIVCYNDKVRWVFLSTLLSLQALIIMWFVMIVRVAIKVIKGSGAEDSRSDDEGEGDEQDDEYEYEEAQLLEEDVGVDEIDIQAWERRAGVKRQAASSGVTLPSHSDRKELLGRIGCDKQVD